MSIKLNVFNKVGQRLTADNTRRIALGMVDQILPVVAVFAVNICLARYGTKEQYGQFVLVYTLYTFLTAVHNAMIVEPFIVLGRGALREYFQGYVYTLGQYQKLFCVLLIVILSVAAYALVNIGYSDYSVLIIGMTISSIFALTATLRRRIFLVDERYGTSAFISTVYAASVFVLLVLICTGVGMSGLSAFIAIGCSWGLALLVARHVGDNDRYKFSPAHLRNQYWGRHWGYAKWVLVTAFVFQLTSQGYYWLVFLFLNGDALAEMRAVHTVVLPFDILITSIVYVSIPIYSQLISEKRHLEVFLSIKKTIALIGGGLLLLAPLIFILGKVLVHHAYDGKYDSVAYLLGGLCLMPALFGISSAFNVGLKALQQPNRILIAYVSSGAMTIVLGAPLVYLLGLQGAVIGMVVSSAIFSATLGFYFVRELKRVDSSASHNSTVPV